MSLPACAVFKRVLFSAALFLVCSPLWAQQIAIVELLLNNASKGEYFVVLSESGDVLLQAQDLAGLPLRGNLGEKQMLNDGEYVSLRSITGLKFKLDPDNAQLHIDADATLFKPNTVDVGFSQTAIIQTQAANSAFLNYAVSNDAIDETHSSQLALELGGRNKDIFALSTFSYDNDNAKLVRLMTSLRSDDRDAMTTFTFGDHFTSAGSTLSSTLVMGGINFSRNFSVAPYYTTSPSLRMHGLLETAAQVDVYSNGYRISQQQLPPGEFTLENIPAQSGLGTTEIVIRDAFGRESVISESNYYSQLLLKPGLSDYSHSLGLIRSGFGATNFDYGDPAIASRYFEGITDRYTLGYTLGISRQHFNLSPAINLLLSRYGTLGMALESSHSDSLIGHGASLDYSYQGRRFSLNAAYRAMTRHYANLGLAATADKPAALFNLGTGINLKRHGALSLRYAESHSHDNADNVSYGLFYNRSLNQRIHFFSSALHHKNDDTPAQNEFFIGLHISLDQRHSANLGQTKRDNERVKQALFQRMLPAGSGGGYSFEVQENANATTWQANGQYQTGVGRYEARYYDNNNYHASAAGGIGYIDDSWFLSRPINDSFAKVKTGGLADVGIAYFGNEIGRSDQNGEAIIPVMRSFHNNRIEIAEKDIPLDYSVDSLTQSVNPDYRSGVVLDFGLNRVRALSGRLGGSDGYRPEFADLKVALPSRTLVGLIGRAGEFYIENVPPGRYSATADDQNRHCRFELVVPDSNEVLLDLGELVCEVE